MKKLIMAFAVCSLSFPAFASSDFGFTDTPSPHMGKGFVCAAKDGAGRYFFGRAPHALEAKTTAAQRCRSSGLSPSIVRGCHLVFCQPQFIWSSADVE